jgi:hypothetical protein
VIVVVAPTHRERAAVRVRAEGVAFFKCGRGPARAAKWARRLAPGEIEEILSVGFVSALREGFSPGDLVALGEDTAGARPCAWAEHPVPVPDERRAALARDTGADVADGETLALARVAAEAGIRLRAVRAVVEGPGFSAASGGDPRTWVAWEGVWLPRASVEAAERALRAWAQSVFGTAGAGNPPRP